MNVVGQTNNDAAGWTRLQAWLLEVSPRCPRVKNVLVPIDFTQSSLTALPYAAFLSREFGCLITLLHVVSLNIVGEERGIPLTRFLEETKCAADRTLQQVAASFGLRSSRLVVRKGEPVAEIVAESQRSHIDLIILGRRPRKGGWRLLFPSISKKVISDAPCLTLVVPSISKRNTGSRRSTTPPRWVEFPAL